MADSRWRPTATRSSDGSQQRHSKPRSYTDAFLSVCLFILLTNILEYILCFDAVGWAAGRASGL